MALILHQLLHQLLHLLLLLLLLLQLLLLLVSTSTWTQAHTSMQVLTVNWRGLGWRVILVFKYVCIQVDFSEFRDMNTLQPK